MSCLHVINMQRALACSIRMHCVHSGDMPARDQYAACTGMPARHQYAACTGVQRAHALCEFKLICNIYYREQTMDSHVACNRY